MHVGVSVTMGDPQRTGRSVRRVEPPGDSSRRKKKKWVSPQCWESNQEQDSPPSQAGTGRGKDVHDTEEVSWGYLTFVGQEGVFRQSVRHGGRNHRNALMKALDLPNRPHSICMSWNLLTDESGQVIRTSSGLHRLF